MFVFLLFLNLLSKVGMRSQEEKHGYRRLGMTGIRGRLETRRSSICADLNSHGVALAVLCSATAKIALPSHYRRSIPSMSPTHHHTIAFSGIDNLERSPVQCYMTVPVYPDR
jgi:hypothetical protein